MPIFLLHFKSTTMIKPFSVTLCLLVLAMACKTPVKSFEKGDYKKSFTLALKECKKGKCSRQNRTIIEKSLAALLEDGKASLGQLEQSYDVQDWEQAIYISTDLQAKIADSQPYVDPIFQSQLDPLVEQEMLLRSRVVDVYFEEGMDRLAYAVRYEDAETARKAYYDFQKANDYSLEPLEIDSLLREAIRYGTVYINVRADMAFEISLDWEIDRQFDDVEGYSDLFTKVSYNGTGQFDCELDVEFDSPDVSFQQTTNSENYESRIIDGYETRQDTSGAEYQVPIYRNVRGRVIIRRQVKTVRLRAEVRVRRSSSNCQYDGQTYYAEIDSEINDVITEGDPRAIPDEFKNVARQEHEDDEDMAEELIEDIYDRFVQDYF